MHKKDNNGPRKEKENSAAWRAVYISVWSDSAAWMLQYVIAIVCFLWFIQVWICLFGAPIRYGRSILLFVMKALKKCGTKIQREKS